MAITDAQFEAWLKADNRERVLLAEAAAYSDGAPVTRYMGTRDFVSGASDTPAHQPYRGIIADVPYFTARLSEVFGGRSESAWGDVVLENLSGVRDSWLNDAWDGWPVNLYVGDPAWARDDFRPILKGVSADLVAMDRARLALQVRDKSWALNVPLQTNRIGGTTANKDKLKPFSAGQLFNAEPVLIDAATHKYQAHDGQADDIPDVRDNGVAVAFAEQLVDGTLTLSAAPTGRITCDVKGAKPAGTYLTTCADIVQHIITTRTSLTTADLDLASFAAFNAACPQTLGYYARNATTVAAVIDELVTSVGGFWTFDRSGLLVLGRFDLPTGLPALELTVNDVALNGLRVVRRIKPVKTVRLGYARNHTVQTEGLAGSVTEANRARYGREYLAVAATNAGIDTAHLLAEEPAEVGTLLVDAAEAQTECTRRATLWGALRAVYEAQCFTAPFKIRVGQVVKLTHPRFGFSGGRLARVVYIREATTRRRSTLQLFA